MDITFAAKEVMNYIGLEGCYFRTDGGITRIAHPVQLSARNCIALSGTQLEPEGNFIFRMQNGSECSVRVSCEPCREEQGLFILTYKEVLPTFIAAKIMEVSKTLRNANRRKEERFIIGVEGSEKFGLLSPVVSLTCGMQHVKCIIANASLHGVKLTGSRSLISKGSSVFFSCRFADEKRTATQKAFVVDACRLESSLSYFSYSLHFIEPLSFLWQRHIVNFEKNTLI